MFCNVTYIMKQLLYDKSIIKLRDFIYHNSFFQQNLYHTNGVTSHRGDGLIL